MPLRPADLDHLSLLVARLLDADLLLAEEDGALLAEIEAARRSLETGAAETACRHTERFVRALEALARDGRLSEAHGRVALEWARRLLDAPAR
jgi:DNA-binding FadR family transcriptional regulator